MKILLLTSTYQSFSEIKIPSFVLDQTINMAEAGGCDFHVLAPHDAKLETRCNRVSDQIRVSYFHYLLPRSLESLNYEGVWPAVRHHPLKIILIPFMVLSFLTKAAIIAVKERPDAIYAHWFTPQAVVAYLVSRFTGIPFFYTSHSSDVWLLRKLPVIGGFIVRLVTRKAKAITVVSKRTELKLKAFFTADEWKEVGRKVSIIPMGVYAEKMVGEAIGDSRDIVFIGRLAEKKGLQFLIPAFDRFASENPDYCLSIAGVGPYRQQVERLVRLSKNKNRIKLLGYVDGGDKVRLIKNSACVVVPSIVTDSGDAEGLPVSLLEGLSQGKPCIATNESGADDILIDGVSGILISQKSENELCLALMRVSGMSKAEIDNMKLAAQKVANQFDWKLVAAKYKDFLEGVSVEEGPDT